MDGVDSFNTIGRISNFRNIYIIQMKKVGRPTHYKPNIKQRVFEMRDSGYRRQYIAVKLKIPFHTVVNILYAESRRKAVDRYYEKNKKRIVKRQVEYMRAYKKRK